MKVNLHHPETILRREGAGWGDGSRGEDSLLGKVEKGSLTHQLQFLVGVQGGAFALRPFLHPLQDVLGTGRVALSFIVDGRFSAPRPLCVAASLLVPTASRGCDTPHKECRHGAGEPSTDPGAPHCTQALPGSKVSHGLPQD